MKVLDIVESRPKSMAESVRLSVETAENRREAHELRTFIVNYRVTEERSSKGTRSQRYDALVAGIEALPGYETHLSTSAWVVKSRLGSGADLMRLLMTPLDPALDFLSVALVSSVHTFGDADLGPDE